MNKEEKISFENEAARFSSTPSYVIFAKLMHHKQQRKYTGEPYWHHCKEVAEIVKQAGGTDAMIAAAWLHDTLEDTDTTVHDLLHYFGPEVASYVVGLTDVEEGANRAERKAKARERLAMQPTEVQMIKLADLISNTKDIVQYDPGFAVTYLVEKEMALRVLRPGAFSHPSLANQHRMLYNVAKYQIEEGKRYLRGLNDSKGVK